MIFCGVGARVLQVACTADRANPRATTHTVEAPRPGRGAWHRLLVLFTHRRQTHLLSHLFFNHFVSSHVVALFAGRIRVPDTVCACGRAVTLQNHLDQRHGAAFPIWLCCRTDLLFTLQGAPASWQACNTAE